MPDIMAREGAAGVFFLEEDPSEGDAWLYVTHDSVVSVEEYV